MHAHFHPFHISQVSLLTATLVYHFCNISRSGFAAEAAELLQTHNGQGHVDVSRLAAREQVRDRKQMNESCRKMVDKHNKHDRNFQSQFPTITNVQHSRRGYECEDFRRLMHRFHKCFCLCLQCVRNMRGILLFLLSVKLVGVLGFHRTVAASAALLTATLSNLCWPTVSSLCSNTTRSVKKPTFLHKHGCFCQSRRKKSKWDDGVRFYFVNVFFE